jgi:hypothetical protein
MGRTKRCPDCAETVLVEARACKHCGYRFDEATEEVSTGTPVSGDPKRWQVWVAAVLIVLVVIVVGGTVYVVTRAKATPPAQAVVDVLERYQNAYSRHNAPQLADTLSSALKRTAEGRNGCESTLGARAALAKYGAQWSSGATRYLLVGLSARAVRVVGRTATVKLPYVIAPASKGEIAFTLSKQGSHGWLITNILASCHTPVRKRRVSVLPADPTCLQYEQASLGPQEEVMAKMGYPPQFRAKLALVFQGMCERENAVPEGVATYLTGLTCAALREGVIVGDYSLGVYEQIGGSRGCTADIGEEQRRLRQEATEAREAREVEERERTEERENRRQEEREARESG